jgi:pyruvate/2-oxoglutarate dehydrogenase complex dihydrolipoamide acyltransferase (E2) component
LVDVCADDQPEDQQTACEAMLLFWYVSPGETVAEGDDLAEIETAKAVVVVQAPAGGVVKGILVREGDAVNPRQKLAVIETPD